jgi:hypothetical protein
MWRLKILKELCYPANIDAWQQLLRAPAAAAARKFRANALLTPAPAS